MIRNQKSVFACLTAVVLFAATTAFASDTAEAIKQRIGSGNPVEGKSASALCQGCHGEDGNSIEGLIPKLAGQYSVYIAKQFRNFQTGEREHQIMSAMSAIISDAELVDIVAYFASQKQMSGGGKSLNQVGKNLFTNGDMARGVLPCQGCHGVNGKGQAPDVSTYPVIGGQQKDYLRLQLTHWRSGERSNSVGGVMNNITKSLTDAEIDALADYISSL
ncbi:MAG: cytochrome c4 [Nitrosomonadales bacterium]|nr:cytochrome c4 [Nitrosomonadales bacterium]